ncbi:hypothetical protein vBPpSSYP_192 [Pseudomonas phage vB_PpS_SYP]|nr:hypothetical protein vBPpSSYP_192 [Pseudomonas phage vB_PpS_SYP]
MRIIVTQLIGDASVNIYNHSGELLHTEGFFGKLEGGSFIRDIPVSALEYHHSKALFDKEFEYKVIV